MHFKLSTLFLDKYIYIYIYKHRIISVTPNLNPITTINGLIKSVSEAPSVEFPKYNFLKEEAIAITC